MEGESEKRTASAFVQLTMSLPSTRQRFNAHELTERLHMLASKCKSSDHGERTRSTEIDIVYTQRCRGVKTQHLHLYILYTLFCNAFYVYKTGPKFL